MTAGPGGLDSLSRRHALALVGASAVAVLVPRWAAAAKPAAHDAMALAAGRSDRSLYKAEGRSLAVSTDGGRAWRELKPPLGSGARLRSVSLSAGASPIIYLAGTGAGPLRSSDGGASWKSIAHGLPSQPNAIAAHARQAQTVYAHVPGRGIFRSEDAGARWRLMDKGPRGGITQFVHSDMAGSMQTGWLFAAGPAGVRLSMDCFCGWRKGGELPLPVRAVAYDPRNPARVLAAAASGLFESTDGGQTWSALQSPPGLATALAVGASGELFAAGAGRLYRQNSGGWEGVDA